MGRKGVEKTINPIEGKKKKKQRKRIKNRGHIK